MDKKDEKMKTKSEYWNDQVRNNKLENPNGNWEENLQRVLKRIGDNVRIPGSDSIRGWEFGPRYRK